MGMMGAPHCCANRCLARLASGRLPPTKMAIQL
jgi:hypothetical protein